MKKIKETPSKDDAAAKARARDARTIGDLVRSMKELNKLRKELEKKGVTSSRKDSEIYEEVLRRLNQFLAGAGKDGVSGKSEPG